jgi:hypothetical protein
MEDFTSFSHSRPRDTRFSPVLAFFLRNLICWDLHCVQTSRQTLEGMILTTLILSNSPFDSSLNQNRKLSDSSFHRSVSKRLLINGSISDLSLQGVLFRQFCPYPDNPDSDALGWNQICFRIPKNWKKISADYGSMVRLYLKIQWPVTHHLTCGRVAETPFDEFKRLNCTLYFQRAIRDHGSSSGVIF